MSNSSVGVLELVLVGVILLVVVLFGDVVTVIVGVLVGVVLLVVVLGRETSTTDNNHQPVS